jgi:CMP-N-acetylneuraminic acid synthetase
MKAVAYFPIKLNNTRLPGKNVKPLSDGTPLIHLVQRSLLSTPGLDGIYCYCSHDAIQEYLLPGVTYLKRPERLDSDRTSGNDIIKAFAETVESDFYVLTHATSPFVKPETYAKALEVMQGDGYDSALSVVPLYHFLWEDGKPNYPLDNKPRSQDLKPVYNETNVFIVTRELALQGKIIGEKPYFFEVDSYEAVDIDCPIDFIVANAIYSGKLVTFTPPHNRFVTVVIFALPLYFGKAVA